MHFFPCGDSDLMANLGHPPIAWTASIAGSRRDNMVFQGEFKQQANFFRHRAVGGEKKQTIEGTEHN